jgi:hypothetical protein
MMPCPEAAFEAVGVAGEVEDATVFADHEVAAAGHEDVGRPLAGLGRGAARGDDDRAWVAVVKNGESQSRRSDPETTAIGGVPGP